MQALNTLVVNRLEEIGIKEEDIRSITFKKGEINWDRFADTGHLDRYPEYAQYEIVLNDSTNPKLQARVKRYTYKKQPRDERKYTVLVYGRDKKQNPIYRLGKLAKYLFPILNKCNSLPNYPQCVEVKSLADLYKCKGF